MADSIQYIKYAVKYPDTNKLGIEDLFIAKDAVTLQQTRGVLPVEVTALNGATLPVGGGDATSIADKLKELFTSITDTSNTSTIVESTLGAIKREFNTLKTSIGSNLTALRKDITCLRTDYNSIIAKYNTMHSHISSMPTPKNYDSQVDSLQKQILELKAELEACKGD